MISSLFNAIGTMVPQVVTLIGGVFEAVCDLIYTAGEGSSAGSLTTFGQLLVVSMAFNLFYFVLRWIRGLIQPR